MDVEYDEIEQGDAKEVDKKDLLDNKKFKWDCTKKEDCYHALDNIKWEEDGGYKTCITRICKSKNK